MANYKPNIGQIVKNTANISYQYQPAGATSPVTITDISNTVTFNIGLLDFGDAPDTSSGTGPGDYKTLLSSNGPRHIIVEYLTLGKNITDELDAYQNPTATGDDILRGIQDDGVTVPVNPIILGASTHTVRTTVVNNTGKTAYLYGWIDFNQNGLFELEEAAPLSVIPSISTAPQDVDVTFNIPSTSTLAVGNNTFMRLRLTLDPLNNTNVALTAEDTRSIGLSPSGEVEDYMIAAVALTAQGVVWYDSNCNGIRESGEPLVQGAVVKIFNVNDTINPVSVTSTDVNGAYSFTNLPSGDYYIVVELPSGYSGFTNPNVGSNDSIDSDVNSSNGKSLNFTLSENNVTQIIDAGLCKCVSVSGKAFYDCGSNGIMSANESTLCGVKVYLIQGGRIINSQTTDCDGNYKFDCVKPGDYSVQFIAPPSMKFSTQNAAYFGSKIDSNTGIANITVAGVDIPNIYGGFKGGYKLQNKYCNNNIMCS